jgi:phosphatidylethanolamine/phosphatidyl-N-methylethanolamine N-methyltransferase
MSEIWRVCKPGGTVVVVNHFMGTHPLRRVAERICTPASQWIGFRLDLPVETVTQTAGLQSVDVESVNLLGLWKLVVLKKTAPPA